MSAIVVAAGISTVLAAQASVTLTLRSGDTLPVMLVDLKAGGFEVTVRGGDRMIPKDQVAMVDFGGNVRVDQSWFRDMTALDHLVVFKNGDTLLTEWVDVGGTSPLILRFNTGRGEREISASEVARIYLVRPRDEGRSNSSGDQPGMAGAMEDGSIAVFANQPWSDGNLMVRTGEFLTFVVSGEIKFGPGQNDVAPADGFAGGNRRAVIRGLPVPSLPVGGLIGKVQNGQPFSIGSAPRAIRMPGNGRLYLGVNDSSFNDNSGWFKVVVRRGR
ncbi:MAG: hypothetical protein HQ485_04580 [Acidobacteria bacterium]|nr:hypothetical protein [Acidobacteriota bacterium]